MIIPMTKGQPQPQGQQPSEADLLMALAEMHKQGRFDEPADDVENKPPDAKDWLREKKQEDLKHRNLKELFDPNNTETPIIPGQSLPDRGQGGTQRRTVVGT